MEETTPKNDETTYLHSSQNYSSTNTTPPAPVKESFFSRLKKSISSISLILAAITLAWLMITFVFQTYVVDGSSMLPTLTHNDRLIVVKLGKSFASVRGDDYIPPRNSVIVFSRQDSVDSSGDNKMQLIKRVVGIPGDRVVVKNGNVTIYNSEYPNGFNPDESDEFSTSTNVTSGNVDITVDDGEVFVLGDNRSNSRDSRSFGTINTSTIEGELKLRILPLSESRSF